MKKLAIYILFSIFIFAITPAFAENISPGCLAIMCLSMAPQDRGGVTEVDCSTAISSYFGIIVKKRAGYTDVTDWDATSERRKEYLSNCAGTDSSTVDSINAQYGKAKSL
jgi:hypothetical protein